MHKNKTLILVLLLIIVAVASSFVSISIVSCYYKDLDKSPIGMQPSQIKATTTSEPIRSTRFQFIKPLLVLGSKEPENQQMIKLQKELTQLLDQKKTAHDISEASICLLDLSSNEEIDLNDQLRFYPASLMKVNTLITLMIQADRNPAFLSQKIQIVGTRDQVRTQSFQDTFKIKTGGSYSIKELIETMIIDSDNLATATLHRVVDVRIFKQILTDLEIPFTEVNDPNFGISASQYARLFRMIYNSAMISSEHAELAMSMLAKSKFEKGFKQGIPSNVVMVDKFGEHGTSPEKDPEGYRQLHECAIFYVDNKPYLVCVMTKGNSLEKLSQTLGDISRIIYKERTQRSS